jgi:hypothetical protein
MSEAILPDVIVGVDTHKQIHAAVVITRLGTRVGELTIAVSLGGYRELETWAGRWGTPAPLASKARARMAPAWRAFSVARAMSSMKSAVPAAGYAASAARRTTSMPRALPVPCSVGRPQPCLSPARARRR